MARNRARSISFGVVIIVVAVAAFASALSAQEFEVASIKRNTSDVIGRYFPPAIRPGQFTAIAMSFRELILFGYPLQTAPSLVLGLPEWAESERYDVSATLAPNATLQDQQQMWRTLLKERLKLEVHYEMRERDAYNLVLARADGRLGPQLQPSTIDCAGPPAGPVGPPNDPDSRVKMLMQRCMLGMLPNGNSLGWYSGGTTLDTLVRVLAPDVRRPVADATGLTGKYSIALRFAPSSQAPTPGAPAAPPSDDPPLFTALQEQLGLKLQPTTVQGQVLVVDHIERPSEN